MYQSNITILNFPEWYRIEKETKKTIDRLYSIKDLSSYLKNPDEYIRRLAIMRINELNLKDSIDVLREVHDDHLESQRNREHAAWTIKSIAQKWDMDFFINSKLLQKFTGSEKYPELQSVTVVDSLPNVNFRFSSRLVSPSVNNEADNTKYIEEIKFDTAFPLREWYTLCTTEIATQLKNAAVTLPNAILKKTGRHLLNIAYLIFIKLPLIILGFMSKAFSGRANKNSLSEEVYYRKAHIRKKSSVRLFVKNCIIKLLYIIIYPLRLVLRHRVFTALVFLSVYLMLTYTTPGRILTYRYFEVDLRVVQSDVFKTAKELTAYAWDDIREITGLYRDVQLQSASEDLPNQHMLQNDLSFRVTARSGLNLRDKPDSVKGRPIDSLAYNTIVTYLSQSQKDTNGKLWYMVQVPGGKTGWVYGGWLEAAGGE